MKPTGFSGKPRTKSRVVRRHWREANCSVPLQDMPRALGWMLEQLRRRKGLSAAWVARRTGLGDQTVRDIEKGHFSRYAYLHADAMARAVHGCLQRVLDLLQHFLWHDYLREKRLHAREPGWQYAYPWSKNRATPPHLRKPA